ncbi:unnamed protein product [Caenorhabditis auriculariae]|uniref:Uncharacterized protein n=1 Tax=Caenorhabditis auriculariae TaxID=2777116 RepID=A0A8S1HCE4_9PELO|nr:unnamed protein product [Caenorhabditis auriculariae]
MTSTSYIHLLMESYQSNHQLKKVEEGRQRTKKPAVNRRRSQRERKPIDFYQAPVWNRPTKAYRRKKSTTQSKLQTSSSSSNNSAPVTPSPRKKTGRPRKANKNDATAQ